MRILFVTDLFPIKDGKEAKLLRAMMWDWLADGHDVEVIKSNFLPKDFRNGKKMYKEGIYFEHGLKIYNLNFITPFWFNYKNKLPKDFDITNYDLVISHMPCGGLMALRLLENHPEIPYISGIHAADIIILTKKLFLSRKYFLYKIKQVFERADAISARSTTLGEKLSRCLPQHDKKIYLGHSGVNPEAIEDENFFKEKSKLSKNPYNITIIASSIKRKNVDIVIKAFKLADIPNSKLRVIGTGKYLKSLKNLANELELKDRIIFDDFIPNANALEKLKQSHVFALLSVRETFGISYLEAGAKANIVIATKNDGVDRTCVFDGENGFTCEPDVKKLANLFNKIYNLTQEEVLRLTLNMRKYLTENDRITQSRRYLKYGLEKIQELQRITSTNEDKNLELQKV